jgi:hypothetical protein
MPLKKGKKNIGKNISYEMKKHPGMKRNQAIAIALNVAGVKPAAGKAAKKGATPMKTAKAAKPGTATKKGVFKLFTKKK